MDEFMARYFVLLRPKIMFLLMVVSALGTIFYYSRSVRAEKHPGRVAISGAFGLTHNRIPTWRRVLDEWIAPLVVWAVVMAMSVSVVGMLLGEE